MTYRVSSHCLEEPSNHSFRNSASDSQQSKKSTWLTVEFNVPPQILPKIGKCASYEVKETVDMTASPTHRCASDACQETQEACSEDMMRSRGALETLVEGCESEEFRHTSTGVNPLNHVALKIKDEIAFLKQLLAEAEQIGEVVRQIDENLAKMVKNQQKLSSKARKVAEKVV